MECNTAQKGRRGRKAVVRLEMKPALEQRGVKSLKSRCKKR